ncbi:aspartate kinase [Ascidiimonas aurantiaca]|uniref:aspartate kinase n=1 Tax=Ascidiimonas aurantiaca TaxID=1685432 RepID=UPI0030EF72C8
MKTRSVPIIVFGKGSVGGTLIDQILTFRNLLFESRHIDLKIIAIANSKHILYSSEGITDNWKSNFKEKSIPYTVQNVVNFCKDHKFEDPIAVDVTSGSTRSEEYPYLIENGFHIVTANKIANSGSQQFYDILRKSLVKNKRQFLYETNVGAALPVIHTLRSLLLSGDEVLKIRGVFSGSLSYIFNRFCNENNSFSQIVREAVQKGFTEPDPREDLCGKDVARKLLILVRELGITAEPHQINVRSLLLPNLDNNVSLPCFNRNLSELDKPFETAKITQKPNHVLRYIGEYDRRNHKLEVKLISEPLNSPLGQLQSSDCLFEIYTASYGEKPLVIQGAGAGKEITARGVLADIAAIANSTYKNRNTNPYQQEVHTYN